MVRQQQRLDDIPFYRRIGFKRGRQFDAISLCEKERHQELIIAVIPLGKYDLLFTLELNLAVIGVGRDRAQGATGTTTLSVVVPAEASLTVTTGTTMTDMNKVAQDPVAVRPFVEMTTLGRVGQPEDIADVIAFLASDRGRWITGQRIDTSGGLRL